MRRLAALLFFGLALAISARAEDWTTADGKTYRNVILIAQEDDGVRIKYDGGVGKIPYYELSDDLLRRFGQDPASLAAKRAAAQKAAADAALKAQQDAAELKKEQDEATAAAATAAAANPPPQTAPPVSKPAPSAAANAAQQAAANAAAAAASPPPTAVVPFSPTAMPTEDNPYPHSKFQYDEAQDISYLDSFPIQLYPISLDASATAPSLQGQGATLFLRVETEGHRAEAPDVVSGMFVSNVPLKKLPTDHKVRFLVDGAFYPGDPAPSESDVPPDASLQATQVVFDVNPEHVRAIVNGKNVNVNVGGYDYRLDDVGLSTLRGYQDDIDHLPPPSTNFVRSYHRLLNRLPSIVTMISTTCEYIILGAFALVVAASIAAFIMGLTRFIKM